MNATMTNGVEVLDILRTKYAVNLLPTEVFTELAKAIAFYARGNWTAEQIAALVEEEYSEHLPKVGANKMSM